MRPSAKRLEHLDKYPPLQRYFFGATPQQAGLTPRETQVAKYVARGLSNKEIAEVIEPSCRARAIESHVRNALIKLDLRNRLQLCLWCLKQSLVSLDDLSIENPKTIELEGKN